MRSEEMASLVPPGLHGKEDVLFGNLNELYTFHSDVFLKDLENCISTTELVALCFVQRVISVPTATMSSKNLIFNQYFILLLARYVLSFVFILLPKYSTIGTIT